jgi:hypothetical protein
MTEAEGIVVERVLPGVGTLTFEQWPIGSKTADGEVRTREYRAYKLDGKRLVSVTSLLAAVLPAPGLVKWAEEQGARGVWRLAQDDLLPADAEDVMRTVRKHALGADAAKLQGATRGLNIHGLLEQYARTGSPPNPADHPAEHRPFIRGLVRWLLKARPEPVAESIEQIVCHPKLGYAGRMDLRAKIGARDLVVDVKTQPKGNIYDKALVQVEMYRWADEYCGAGPADGTLVVVFDATGGFHEMDGVATKRTVTCAVNLYKALRPINNALTRHIRARPGVAA